jgi:hypothetical protein
VDRDRCASGDGLQQDRHKGAPAAAKLLRHRSGGEAFGTGAEPWPWGPICSTSTATWLRGGTSQLSAEASSGPLENSHTGMLLRCGAPPSGGRHGATGS